MREMWLFRSCATLSFLQLPVIFKISAVTVDARSVNSLRFNVLPQATTSVEVVCEIFCWDGGKIAREKVASVFQGDSES